MLVIDRVAPLPFSVISANRRRWIPTRVSVLCKFLVRWFVSAFSQSNLSAVGPGCFFDFPQLTMTNPAGFQPFAPPVLGADVTV